MAQNNNKSTIRLEEQIKSLCKESSEYQGRLEKFIESFYKFKDNDFHHLKLDVERLKIAIGMNNKITWVILLSVLGLAFFVIRSIIIK